LWLCVVVSQDGYVDVHQGIDRVLEDTRDYEGRGKTVSRFGKGCGGERREREGCGIVCNEYVCMCVLSLLQLVGGWVRK